MPEAVFLPDGPRFVPTALAAGPWDPGAAHGGAPAALLGRAIEAAAPDGDMHVARVSVEFLRPVPLAPLEVETELLRPGRRVQLLGARLRADGTEVCRATALRIRRAAGAAPAPATPSPPGPEQGRAEALARSRVGGFGGTAVEQRFVAGDWSPGPATVWMRLTVPLVAGEEPSPLVRVLAAADFGNGVGPALDWNHHLFINPDLTVYLERPAEGEWVCLEAATHLGVPGTAVAESVLFDVRGRLGRAVQALLVEPRG
jgi:hypothetical protein